MMQDVDQDILEDFVVESKENLESIEDDFLELEKCKDTLDVELINKIFRAIHSIKDSSGFLALNNLGDLAHKMENLISKMRDLTLPIQSAHIDSLLEGVDFLKVMLDDIENQEAVDCVELKKY